MLQHRLERQGYTVIQAANGREALEIIDRGGLDLVLLDIVAVPEVDGYEVCGKSRRHRAAGICRS